MTLDAFFGNIFAKKANNLIQKETQVQNQTEQQVEKKEEMEKYTKREKKFLAEIEKLRDENEFFRKEVGETQALLVRLKEDGSAVLEKYIPRLFKIVYEEGFFDGIKYRTNADNPSEEEAREIIAMRLESKADFIEKLIFTMKKPFIKKEMQEPYQN